MAWRWRLMGVLFRAFEEAGGGGVAVPLARVKEGGRSRCWDEERSPGFISERVSDGELEADLVFPGLPVDRDAPLEAERAERREPAEAEAPGVADAADVEAAGEDVVSIS